MEKSSSSRDAEGREGGGSSAALLCALESSAGKMTRYLRVLPPRLSTSFGPMAVLSFAGSRCPFKKVPCVAPRQTTKS